MLRAASNVACQAPAARPEWTPPKPHFASPQLRNADGLPRASPSSQAVRFAGSTSTPPSQHPCSRAGGASPNTSSPAASPSLFAAPLPRHPGAMIQPAPRSSAFSWTDSSVDGGSATMLEFATPSRSETPATPERSHKTSIVKLGALGTSSNQHPPSARSRHQQRPRGSSTPSAPPPMPFRGWSFDSIHPNGDTNSHSEALSPLSKPPLPPSQALRAFHESPRPSFEPSYTSTSIFVDSDEEEERLLTGLVENFFGGRSGGRNRAGAPAASKGSPSPAKRGLFGGLPKSSPTGRLRTLSDASSKLSIKSNSDDGHRRSPSTQSSPLVRPARLLFSNLTSSHNRTKSNASTASASTVASSAISLFGNGGHCSDSSSSTCTGASHRPGPPLKTSDISVRQVGAALGVGLGVGAPLRLDEHGHRRFDGAEVVRRPQDAFVTSHRAAPTVPSAIEAVAKSNQAIHVPIMPCRPSTPPFSDLVEESNMPLPQQGQAFVSPRPLLVYDPNRRPRRPLLTQALTQALAPAPLPKSPPLPPAPSRMEAWRELLRPQAAKELPAPSRPRRPSEAATHLPARNPLSPRSRLAAAARRGPRPQRAPIPSYDPPPPPPPKDFIVISSHARFAAPSVDGGDDGPSQPQSKPASKDQHEKALLERKESERKTKGLLIALGMRQPKLSVSHADAGTCTEDEEDGSKMASSSKMEACVMTDRPASVAARSGPPQPLLLAPPSPSQWRRQRQSMAAARRSGAQPRNSVLSHSSSTPSNGSSTISTRPADVNSISEDDASTRSASPCDASSSSSSSDEHEDEMGSEYEHLSHPFSLSPAPTNSASQEAELAHTSFLAMDASDPLSPTSSSSQQLLFDIQTSPRTTKTNGFVSQGLLSPLLTSSQVAEHRLRSASPYQRRCPSNVDSDEGEEDDEDEEAMWSHRDPRMAALA